MPEDPEDFSEPITEKSTDDKIEDHLDDTLEKEEDPVENNVIKDDSDDDLATKVEDEADTVPYSVNETKIHEEPEALLTKPTISIRFKTKPGPDSDLTSEKTEIQTPVDVKQDMPPKTGILNLFDDTPPTVADKYKSATEN